MGRGLTTNIFCVCLILDWIIIIIVFFWALLDALQLSRDLKGEILNTEFLNVTVSSSCDGPKFCWICAIFLDLYMQAGKFMILFIFNFLFKFTHFMSKFTDLLAIFLCKVVKSKILTAHKNPLLECLIIWYFKKKKYYW